MLDIKLIRTNPDLVKAKIQKREMNLDHVVDEILELDAQRREMTGKVEALKAEQNAESRKIPQMKKAGEDTTELMARMKSRPTRFGTRMRSWKSWRPLSRKRCCLCPTCPMMT